MIIKVYLSLQQSPQTFVETKIINWQITYTHTCPSGLSFVSGSLRTPAVRGELADTYFCPYKFFIMDEKAEPWLKYLLLVLFGIILIQFVIIIVICSCDYLEYKKKVARYEAERDSDTLNMISPNTWQTEYPYINEDFPYER